jgi:hypothetical protein
MRREKRSREQKAGEARRGERKSDVSSRSHPVACPLGGDTVEEQGQFRHFLHTGGRNRKQPTRRRTRRVEKKEDLQRRKLEDGDVRAYVPWPRKTPERRLWDRHVRGGRPAASRRRRPRRRWWTRRTRSRRRCSRAERPGCRGPTCPSPRTRSPTASGGARSASASRGSPPARPSPFPSSSVPQRRPQACSSMAASTRRGRPRGASR